MKIIPAKVLDAAKWLNLLIKLEKKKIRKVEISHNILTQVIDKDRCVTYTKEQAVILAQLIADIRESFCRTWNVICAAVFL